MTRAAVVGASGFIGRRLATALRAAGITTAGYTREHPLTWPRPVRPDVVYHLATSVTPAIAELRPDLARADRDRLARLLHAMAVDRSAPRPLFVYASSAGTVYDPALPGPRRESDPTRATCAYGRVKLAGEELVRRYPGPAVIVRLSNVYGPGQRADRAQGVLGHWLRAAAAGAPLRLIGDPATTRDYVYVDDVVDALVRLAAARPDRPDRPLVLNIGSGRATSLAALLDAVLDVVGRPLDVVGEPARNVDRPGWSLDVRRAEDVLGWRARTPLHAGVAATWSLTTAAETGRQGFVEPAYRPRAHAGSRVTND